MVIDIGVGTYTAQTFSSSRYDLFYMQSQYHNCPSINGVDQKAGEEFNSHETNFKELPNQEGVYFQSNIVGAYPNTTQAKQWIRSIEFNQTTSTVIITDQYELVKFVAPQKLHFIIPEIISIDKTVQGIHLYQRDKLVNVNMEFDWQLFNMEVEIKSLEHDHHLTNVWGENVKRITLITNDQYNQLKGVFSVRFSPAN